MLTPVAFWYLRHGETDWNARGWSQGNVDVPMNDIGRAQAREAAAALRGKGIVSIVASPLGRTRETAAACAEALGLPVAIDEDLREVSFGVQEGQPMSDWFTGWVAGTLTPERAESFAALRVRVAAAINRALQRKPVVLIVGHGAFFRALRAEMGLPPDVRTPNGAALFCGPPSEAAAPWSVEAVQVVASGT